MQSLQIGIYIDMEDGMRVFALAISFLAMFATALPVFADAPQQSTDPTDFLDSLDPQYGVIDLPNGVAQLDVPETFRYLNSADAQRFLEEGWGNPDGSGTLGMLLPTDRHPLGEGAWGVVISYQEDGHVEDKDAASIDYDELLASMQEGTEEGNKERQKIGYDPVYLVGWATRPHYDSGEKKLYWAQELNFGDLSEENTLNYCVRILGRKGVLELNAVSSMSQLASIEKDMKQVLAFSDFKEGFRYSDYDSGVDKVATYGIAALIGGKIAAKAGLLAKLGALLLAFKKVIFVAIAAVGGFVLKLFRRKPAVESGVSVDSE